MAPKHQPAMVKMTLKAAAILTLSLDHCVCVTTICCAVPGVWCLVRLGIGCSQLMSEPGHPLASLEAGSGVTSAAH